MDPLLETISFNNIEIVQLLVNYLNKNNIILKLINKNNCGWYPILEVISNNNIKIDLIEDIKIMKKK